MLIYTYLAPERPEKPEKPDKYLYTSVMMLIKYEQIFIIYIPFFSDVLQICPMVYDRACY